MIADHLPWLERYSFHLLFEHEDGFDVVPAFARLSNLKALDMDLIGSKEVQRLVSAMNANEEGAEWYPMLANAFLGAVGTMQQLEKLKIKFYRNARKIRYKPLIGLRQLRSLHLLFGIDSPSAEQIAALRQMHWLERLDHNFRVRCHFDLIKLELNGTLRLLLQAPTLPFRWKSLRVLSGAVDWAPQMQSLSDLTSLTVDCRCGNVELLLSLPQIRSLRLLRDDDLNYFDRHFSAAELASIVTTLQHCPQLTSLSLEDLPFTSAHLRSPVGSASCSAIARKAQSLDAGRADVAELPRHGCAGIVSPLPRRVLLPKLARERDRPLLWVAPARFLSIWTSRVTVGGAQGSNSLRR